jgi:hypothetical protein
MKNLIAAGMLLGATVLAASCTFESPPPATPMVPASAGAISREQAAELLAQARCDREFRCQGIGSGARFPTLIDCLSVMRRDAAQSFATCRFQVKERELRACMQAVQGQPCGAVAHPFEWFARLATCRPDNLCLQ